jgi:HEPN domain-containing protein
MTTLDLAAGLFRQATARLSVARMVLAEGNNAYCIRSCQEAVELALKAMLIREGIDPPKWHDVGRIVRDHRERLPALTDHDVDEMCFISSKLRADRERSMYGDEETSLSPEELYSRHDAEVSLEWAEKVVALVKRQVGTGGGPT